MGFPNDRQEYIEELVEFVEEGYFQHLGVFLYSDEDNIRSAQLSDPVPHSLKKEWRDQLMELQQRVNLKNNRVQIGAVQNVLVKKYSNRSTA